MKEISKELYHKLQEVHGQGRVLVLVAGRGPERVEFAFKRLDAKEWEVFLAFQANKDEGAAESMLVRAAVGDQDESTKAERERLQQELEQDPQLGDFWGVQLLEAAGFQAKVQVDGPGRDGDWTLTAKVEGQPYSVVAKRLSRLQYTEVRRVLVRNGDTAADVLAFKLCTGLEAGAYDLRPALPQIFGSICMGLGTKAGAAPKFFPG